MSTISIQLPDEMKFLLEQQSLERGYPSVSEYFQDIFRIFQEFVPDAGTVAYLNEPEVRKKIEEKLLEGYYSPSVVVDEAYWQERRRKRREKHHGAKSEVQSRP